MRRNVLIALTALMLTACAKETKIGYVKIQQIFLDFEYKKELEKNLRGVQEKRKTMLDSLELELKVLSRQIESEQNKDKLAEFEARRENYLNKKQEFDDSNERVVKQYDEQIIRQMNQYVKDYGEKNGYTFIYGAGGSGNLMYADSTYDITKKVTEYINERYKGQKK